MLKQSINADIKKNCYKRPSIAITIKSNNKVKI